MNNSRFLETVDGAALGRHQHTVLDARAEVWAEVWAEASATAGAEVLPAAEADME